MRKSKNKIRKNGITKAATTKTSKRVGASAKTKVKAKVTKAATGNIRSNPFYKKGFEAGLKAGMKRGNLADKSNDVNI